MSPEVKVGAFFFLAIGLAVTFTVIVRPDWQAQGDYAVSFPRVSKLKQGDQVMYNGVRIGQVTAVEPILGKDGSPSVLIRFSVEKRFKTVVLISPKTIYRISQGVLGGANLDIFSTSGEPISPQIISQARGEEPASLDETINSLQRIVEENRDEIRKAISAIRVGAENLGGMAGEIKGAVVENRAGLKVAVDNIGAASGSINAVVVENRESIKIGIDNIRIMADQIGVVVAENRDQIRAAIANLSKAGDQVGETLKENRAAIKQTADSLASFGPKLERIGDNLELITAQIAKGQGTLGRLVMEDTIYTKTESTLDSAQQRLEEVKPFTSGFSDLRFYPGVAYDVNAQSGRTTGTAYLRIEPRPWKYYEFGVSYRSKPDELKKEDKEDPDKINADFRALFGWRFFRNDEAQLYRLSIGAGFIESNLGGVASVNLTRDLTLDLMGRHKDNSREPNDRRYEEGKVLLRASLSYRLWQRISISAGCDDLIEQPGLWGGVRGEILDDDIRNFFSVTSIIK